MSRVLIVSHPSVVGVNQEVYVRLAELGWTVRLVVPSLWRHDYAKAPSRPTVAAPLAREARLLPVLFGGSPLRHVHRVPIGRVIDAFRPDVAFVEQEPFAAITAQWVPALVRRRVPFALQQDENLERRLPPPIRPSWRHALANVSFVAARSDKAAALLTRVNPGIHAPVLPHPVPEWPHPAARPDRPFTIGFAGRFVPEKGLLDLVAAHASLPGARLLLVGDGAQRKEIERLTAGRDVEIRVGVEHAAMAAVYAEMDVLVLPSRTTSGWAEQFGRVLLEALWCGTPVVGSDSGEIPWVIAQTGGGATYPEGDVPALTDILRRLQGAPAERAAFAATGRAVVEQRFTTTAVARQLSDLLSAAATNTT